jgi:hypothetical protein
MNPIFNFKKKMTSEQPSAATTSGVEVVNYDWKETPFDPTDTRPFIRKPTGKLWAPCGLRGPKCVKPVPWLWMFPAVLGPLIYFLFVVLDENDVWERVVATLSGIVCIVLLLLADTSDPGVIPPARVGDPEPQPVTINIEDVGDVELEVCKTCKIVRPPRSSHCKYADVCVRDYDHTCTIVNSVIAIRTFRWFTWFNWASFTLVVFGGLVTIYKVSKEWDVKAMLETEQGQIKLFATVLFLLILCAEICWSVWAGTVYCYYAGTDLTLKDLKGRKTFKNTKDRKWTCSNAWVRLCSFEKSHYPDSIFQHADVMTWDNNNENNDGTAMV